MAGLGSKLRPRKLRTNPQQSNLQPNEFVVLTLQAEVAALVAKNAAEEAPASSFCWCLNSTAKLQRKANDAQRKVDKAVIAAGRKRFSEVRPELFSHSNINFLTSTRIVTLFPTPSITLLRTMLLYSSLINCSRRTPPPYYLFVEYGYEPFSNVF